MIPNDNTTSASSSPSALSTAGTELSVEQIQAQYHQALSAAREREHKKLQEQREQTLAKINELPTFVGVSTLAEVAALLRDVLRGSKPVSTPVPRPGAARSDRDKAVAAVKNNATQKQIEDTFDYSAAWYYKTRKQLGMSKVYAPSKRKVKGRFPARA